MESTSLRTASGSRLASAAKSALTSSRSGIAASHVSSSTSALLANSSSRWIRHRSRRPSTHSATAGVGPLRIPSPPWSPSPPRSDAALRCSLSSSLTSSAKYDISSCRLVMTLSSATACASLVACGSVGNRSFKGPNRWSSASSGSRSMTMAADTTSALARDCVAVHLPRVSCALTYSARNFCVMWSPIAERPAGAPPLRPPQIK